MLKLHGLNRPLFLFLLHSAILNIGLLGITDVILNFYFRSLNVDAEMIGLLQALSRAGSIFTGVPIGLLADRIGTRKVIIASALGASFSFVPMVLFPTLPVLIISRIVFGIFFGAAFIAAAPLMMVLVSKEHVSHAFAYHQIATLAGTALGSLIGGYLPTWMISLIGLPETAAIAGVLPEQTPFAYGAAILMSGLTVFISIVPILRLQDRPTPSAAPTVVSTVHEPPMRTPWRLLMLMAIPTGLFGMSAGLTFPFYNLFFRDRFGISDETVGTILGIGWLMMGLVSMSTPWWERHFGRSRALVINLLVAAFAYVVLGASELLWVGILAFFAAASIRNLLVPLLEPLRLEAVPKAIHNLASAVGSVAWSLGWFTSGAFSGWLQKNYGFDVVFYLVSGLLILTAFSIFVVFLRKPSPSATESAAPQSEPQTSTD